MDSQTALIVIVLISAVVFLPRLTRRGGKGDPRRDARHRPDKDWSGADAGSDYGGSGD